MSALQAELIDSIMQLDTRFLGEASEGGLEKALNKIDLRLHIEVAMPSINECNETAGSLLKKAIQNDWNSLEKLTKIDKWVTRVLECYWLEDSGSQVDGVFC